MTTKPVPTVVLDTSVLMEEPHAYRLPQLDALGPMSLVVPAVVLWELDRLMERVESRDRARAALNTLREWTSRGALLGPISLGENRTVRICGFDEARWEDPLNKELADDRILAAALAQEPPVNLATTEFALFAKALSLGVSGIHVDLKKAKQPPAERKERAGFESAWRRVEAADTPWKVMRRGLTFLDTPLCRRVLAPVRETGEPQLVALVVSRFDGLRAAWQGQTVLNSILKSQMGWDPPLDVNYAVQNVTVPGKAWAVGVSYQEMQPTQRVESPEERAIRLRASERIKEERESYIVDCAFSELEVVWAYVLEQAWPETP